MHMLSKLHRYGGADISGVLQNQRGWRLVLLGYQSIGVVSLPSLPPSESLLQASDLNNELLQVLQHIHSS